MAGADPVGPTVCPCGRGRYAACCGPLHAGQLAASAEDLMRARYSAYVLGLGDFVLGSWHASTRPATAASDDDARTTWLGLSVKRHEARGDRATVEFVARYRVGGRGHRLHEVSRFLREEGRWYYVDGDIVGDGGGA